METSRKGINLIKGFGPLDLADLPPVEKAVNDLRYYFRFPLNQNQFDALVSFGLDAGVDQLGHFAGMDVNTIANEISRYCYADGHKDPTLEQRRNAERDLFLSGVDERSPKSSHEATKSDGSSQASGNAGIWTGIFTVGKWLWDNGYVEKAAKWVLDCFTPSNSTEQPSETNKKETPQPPSSSPKKSTHEVASEDIRGNRGNGEERKRRLTYAELIIVQFMTK